LIVIYACLHEDPLLDVNELPEEWDATPAGKKALTEVMTDALLYSVDSSRFCFLS